MVEIMQETSFRELGLGGGMQAPNTAFAIEPAVSRNDMGSSTIKAPSNIQVTHQVSTPARPNESPRVSKQASKEKLEFLSDSSIINVIK